LDEDENRLVRKLRIKKRKAKEKAVKKYVKVKKLSSNKKYLNESYALTPDRRNVPVAAI